jgi:hypothetical protein
MRRRDFIKIVYSVAAWPFAVRAQQAVKTAQIGFMGRNSRCSIEPGESAAGRLARRRKSRDLLDATALARSCSITIANIAQK